MFQSSLRWVRSVAASLALALPAVSASADVPVTYTDVGRGLFTIMVPDFWVIQTGGLRDLTDPKTEETRQTSRVLGLQPATEPRMWMGFVSPHGVRSFEEATAYLQDIGPFLVRNAQVDGQKSARIGGLPARTFAGRGTRDGKAVTFTAVVIDLPGPRMAVSIVVIEAGAAPDLVDDINAVFASFRAVR
jgi:hypothetical protein